MAEFKRVHYYNHQYLREPDFTAEQDYHLSMRRRHNRSLHTWGIVDGLLISKEGDGKIRVSAGMAIDKHGREMEFDGGTLDIAVETDAVRFVIITHVEEQTDPPEQQFKINDTDRTRWTERAEVRIVSEAPANPGQDLIVGRITIKGGTISIDDGAAPNQRRLAGATGGSFHTRGGEEWSTWNYGASLIIDGGRNNAIALLDGTSANPWAIANAGGELTIAQMPPLGDLSTAPTRRLLIDQDGNVGIGTGEPGFKLDVNGPVRLGGFSGDDKDEWPNLVWYRDVPNGWDEGLIKGSHERGVWNRPGFGIHLHSSRHFMFASEVWDTLLDIEGGTGRTYIKGDVGIGTSSPGAKLDVNGDLRVAGNFAISGTLSRLDVADEFTATVRAADFLLGHSSRRGTPGRALVDYGDTLHINFGGDWSGGVKYHNSMSKLSSRRFKENIAELTAHKAFEILKGLHPVRFNLKAEAGKRIHLGFIAEDTHPYVASEGRDAIDNDHIVAVLTRVVKAQQKTMAKFEQKLKLMEKA